MKGSGSNLVGSKQQAGDPLSGGEAIRLMRKLTDLQTSVLQTDKRKKLTNK